MIRPVLVSALLFSIFWAPSARAQNLSGTWEGRGSYDGAQFIRLVIISCDDVYVGYSFDTIPGFCQANFEGRFHPASRTLKGENRGMIRRSPDHVQSSFDLTYIRREGVEYLQGNVSTKGALSIFNLGVGEPVRLRKVSDRVDTTAYMKACLDELKPARRPPPPVTKDTIKTIIPPKDTLKTLPPASIQEEKLSRANDTAAVITSPATTIQISMYDNGQIDGDTITVFYNNRILVEKLEVSAQPYTFSFDLDESNPVQEIVLVANNLGSIPPNTALLVIEAGGKKYQVFASSDLRRNSVVVFRLGK